MPTTSAAGRVTAQVASAAVAGGVAETHTLDAPWIVSRHALTLAGHSKLGMTKVLGSGICAFRHNIAQAFPPGDLLGELDHLSAVAPSQFAIAVGIAFFGGFHVNRKRVPDLNRVDAEIVARVDHLGYHTDIIIAAVCTHRPGWLVLDRLHAQASIRSIFDLDFLLARHRAGVAGGVANQNIVR